MDWFLCFRLSLYGVIVLFIVTIVCWLERVPGNGARHPLRMLTIPLLTSWLAVLASVVLKAFNVHDHVAISPVVINGLVTVCCLVELVRWRGDA